MLAPLGGRDLRARFAALAGFPHRQVALPNGALGTWSTLHYMRRLAGSGASLTHQVSQRILQSTPLRDGWGEAVALRGFLARRFRFLADPEGVEYLQAPDVLLTQLEQTGEMTGDCDDAAIIGAALARALGLRARFRAVAFPKPMSPYRHVIADVLTPRGWLDLDVTKPAQLIPPTFTRTMIMEV